VRSLKLRIKTPSFWKKSKPLALRYLKISNRSWR
jgi:hypothetical protein